MNFSGNGPYMKNVPSFVFFSDTLLDDPKSCGFFCTYPQHVIGYVESQPWYPLPGNRSTFNDGLSWFIHSSGDQDVLGRESKAGDHVGLCVTTGGNFHYGVFWRCRWIVSIIVDWIWKIGCFPQIHRNSDMEISWNLALLWKTSHNGCQSSPEHAVEQAQRPPSTARYGRQGAPGVIPPYADLVFEASGKGRWD